MAQTGALMATLKQVLREQGVTYAQVAAHLNLSEASVKRLFAQQQFTLKRLDQVCQLLGIEISDLARRLEAKRNIAQLSLEQEEELVRDTGLLLVAVSAVNGWTFQDLLATYRFSETALIRHLAKLDRIKLIELLPGNRIKPLITADFSWRKNGPIQDFFECQVQQDFFTSQFDQPGELRLFVTGMLSAPSNQLIQQKLRRLAQDFRHYHQEDRQLPLAQRHGTSLVLAMRPWELQAFARLRRPDAVKIYRQGD